MKKKIGDYVFIFLFALVMSIMIWVIIDDITNRNQMKKWKELSKSSLKSGPIQTRMKEEKIILDGVEITKLAKYDITGIVLGKEYYYFGKNADKISPEDLVLCWGVAAENKDDIKINWGLNDRKASLYILGDLYKKYGDEALNYISNNHIIPINKNVKDVIKKVRIGNTVHITGYLVYCKGKNWTWGPSSLVRTDDGDGACEIILTESIVIDK